MGVATLPGLQEAFSSMTECFQGLNNRPIDVNGLISALKTAKKMDEPELVAQLKAKISQSLDGTCPGEEPVAIGTVIEMAPAMPNSYEDA